MHKKIKHVKISCWAHILLYNIQLEKYKIFTFLFHNYPEIVLYWRVLFYGHFKYNFELVLEGNWRILLTT